MGVGDKEIPESQRESITALAIHYFKRGRRAGSGAAGGHLEGL